LELWYATTSTQWINCCAVRRIVYSVYSVYYDGCDLRFRCGMRLSTDVTDNEMDSYPVSHVHETVLYVSLKHLREGAFWLSTATAQQNLSALSRHSAVALNVPRLRKGLVMRATVLHRSMSLPTRWSRWRRYKNMIRTPKTGRQQRLFNFLSNEIYELHVTSNLSKKITFR
jgi:hypothetical protein